MSGFTSSVVVNLNQDGYSLNTVLTDGTQRSKITDGNDNADVTNNAPSGSEEGLIVRNIPSGIQTVNGAVTANIGTTNGLALDATLTNGAIKSQIYDGSNIIGTSTHPVRTDTTGTTTQPISGTVTANAGTGNFTVTQSTASNLNANVSGTITANIGTTNGLALDNTLISGTVRTKLTDGSNNVDVKAASTSPSATDKSLVVSISPNSNIPSASDNTASGTLSNTNDYVQVSTNGCSHVSVAISGTWTGILSARGTIDGINYIDLSMFVIETSIGAQSPSASYGQEDTTTNGTWMVNCHGFAFIRLFALTLSSGSATVFLRATVADGPPNVQAIMPADCAALDAFSRQRVSTPETLFASKQIFDNQPLFFDDQQISGAGTSSSYLTNKASTSISVTGNIAGSRVRQTFRRFNYEANKSLLVTLTSVMINEGGSGAAGINRRVGYFDNNNGLFFIIQGTTPGICVRTFTSGSVVDNIVNQSDWNLDRLDGYGGQTNPSGRRLDLSKAQIFSIDFQWLGTGRIRFGFNIDGVLTYCHQVLNANNKTDVYMSTPNLPIRYEIESLGTASATTYSLKHICASVESEGGFEGIGFQLSADRGATLLKTGNNTSIYALLIIRLKSGFGGATIIPNSITVMCSDAASFRYGLLINPTVAGSALSWTSITNSSVEYSITDNTNTLTGGTLVFSDYQISSKSGSASSVLPGQFQIGSNIAGVSDILAIFVQPTPAFAGNYYATINFNETI